MERGRCFQLQSAAPPHRPTVIAPLILTLPTDVQRVRVYEKHLGNFYRVFLLFYPAHNYNILVRPVHVYYAVHRAKLIGVRASADDVNARLHNILRTYQSYTSRYNW